MFPVLPGIQFLNVGLGRMIAFRDKFEERSIQERFQFRLLRMAGRHGSDEFQIVRFDRVGRERHRHLIEQPLIDKAGFAHEMRMLVGNERLAKKLAHFAIDLSRPKIIVIEKNLQPGCRLLIVIRQRDVNFGGRLRSRRSNWCRRRATYRRRCRLRSRTPPLPTDRVDSEKNRSECDGAHERESHWRKVMRWRMQLRKFGWLSGSTYRFAPAGNMTFSGAAFSAVRSFGIKRVLIEPASRGGTR